MLILGIETSCDETAAAVIKANDKNEKVELLSNVVASSLSLHAKTGGIIPEVAAREQIKYIIPVIKESLKVLKNPQKEIDAIAVTVGPGLIGSLLIGVETARTISYVWKKPLIGVNHLFGHIYANWIDNENINSGEVQFPFLSLVVSGGHTDLVLIKNHRNIKWLGGTRDDAAGEAFDKIGRLLDLPYPGGPSIEKNARAGNSKRFNFPKPLIDSDDFDFSFSGLKTAALREITKLKEGQDGKLNQKDIEDICACLQKTIIDVLVFKTLKAAQNYKARSILLGGGVSANQELRDELKLKIENLELKIELFVPTKSLCTDNGAMIAAAGFFNYRKTNWQQIKVNPELYFD